MGLKNVFKVNVKLWEKELEVEILRPSCLKTVYHWMALQSLLLIVLTALNNFSHKNFRSSNS